MIALVKSYTGNIEQEIFSPAYAYDGVVSVSENTARKSIVRKIIVLSFMKYVLKKNFRLL